MDDFPFARINTPRLVREYLAALRLDPCAYCDSQEGGHLDHIVPRARNGGDEWSNLIGACKICNSRKSARPLLIALLALLGQPVPSVAVPKKAPQPVRRGPTRRRDHTTQPTYRLWVTRPGPGPSTYTPLAEILARG